MPPYTWDTATNRYRDKKGRFIPQRTVRNLLNISLNADEAKNLTGSYKAGDITVDSWRKGMRALIKRSYIQSALLARGGRSQMTAADWGKVGGHVAEQYSHLDQKANSFFFRIDGTPVGQAENIAGMYINSARQVFEEMNRENKIELGAVTEKWMLSSAEHCSSCLELNGLGRVPLGTLWTVPGAGETICLTNCKCRIAYFNQAGRTLSAKEVVKILLEQNLALSLGGKGSGHHGHKGVPGQRGGSAPSKGISAQGSVEERAASFIISHRTGERPEKDVAEFLDTVVLGQKTLGQWAEDTLAEVRPKQLVSSSDFLTGNDLSRLQSIKDKGIWSTKRTVEVVGEDKMPTIDRVALEKEWGISRYAVIPNTKPVGTWSHGKDGFVIQVSTESLSKRHTFWHEFSHTIPGHVIEQFIGKSRKEDTPAQYAERFARKMSGSPSIELSSFSVYPNTPLGDVIITKVVEGNHAWEKLSTKAFVEPQHLALREFVDTQNLSQLDFALHLMDEGLNFRVEGSKIILG